MKNSSGTCKRRSQAEQVSLPRLLFAILGYYSHPRLLFAILYRTRFIAHHLLALAQRHETLRSVACGDIASYRLGFVVLGSSALRSQVKAFAKFVEEKEAEHPVHRQLIEPKVFEFRGNELDIAWLLLPSWILRRHHCMKFHPLVNFQSRRVHHRDLKLHLLGHHLYRLYRPSCEAC